MKVVIQAGGKGMRLRPYTTVLPKPLLPVGSKPVLELLLRWVRRNGARDVYITTGYLGHLIRAFCGDGRQWDLNIIYSEERETLGTIGALSLLREELNETFLVINGDVLTDLNVGAFVRSHRASGAALSVATMRRSIRLDFGVIEAEEGMVALSGEAASESFGQHGHLLHGAVDVAAHPAGDPIWVRRFGVPHVGPEVAGSHISPQRLLAGRWPD